MDGLRFWKKRDTAPDFVMGRLVLTLDDIAAWFKANPTLLTDYQGKKQVTLQITTGREGGLVFAVDTYKKEEAAAGPGPKPAAVKSDLPFEDDPGF